MAVAAIPPSDPLPPYAYRCRDGSWLTGFIAARIAPRVETWLPASWSANRVTAVGSLLIWMFWAGVLLCPSPARERLAPLWAALLLGYCLLDHVDGCRARRRGSSSPWGEFLDHALDAWHGGIAVYALGAMGGRATHPAVVAVTVACVALATVATWLEQKVRGEFLLGAIGPVEAVAGAAIYLLIWIWPGARALGLPFSARSALTWADLALALGAAGNLITVASAAARTRLIARPLLAQTLLIGALLGLSVSLHLSWTVSGVAILILTAEYSARVITSHLSATPLPWPDVVGPTLLAGAALLPAWPGAAAAGLLWLALRAGLTWRSSRRKLGGAAAGWAPDLAFGAK